MTNLPTPKKLSRWFKKPASQVEYYHSKTERLLKLNHLWKKQKDIAIVFHSLIANVENGILVIAIENSDWASHLHYAKFELLTRLKSWPQLEGLMDIKWYVASPDYELTQNTVVSKRAIVSQDSQQLIRSVASTLPQSLQDALLKLIEH